MRKLDIPSSNNVLNFPIIAAPMEGYTDLPFFEVLYQIGAPDYFFTPFIRITEGFKGKNLAKSLTIYQNLPYFDKIAIQLMGNRADLLAEAAQVIQEEGFSWVDLNVGCPAKTVVKHRSGAYLLSDLSLLESIIEMIASTVSIRFSVKIRSGLTSSSSFDQILDMLKDLPIDFLTIHPRTANQAYRGSADWSLIRKACETLNIPIIGNGDITSLLKMSEMITVTGCEAVMIGRGMLENPWVFKQAYEHRQGKSISPISYQQRLEFFTCLMDEYLKRGRPDKQIVSRLKAFAIPQLKGKKDDQGLLKTLLHCKSCREFQDELSDFSALRRV